FVGTLTIREVLEENFDKISEITSEFPKYKLLIRYLLSEGHIDEQYNYYISNLYEDMLSANDVTIVQKIKSNTPLNEQEKIINNNYGLVLFELTENDYKKIAILNKDIILYVFNNSKYAKQQSSIAKTFIHKL